MKDQITAAIEDADRARLDEIYQVVARMTVAGQFDDDTAGQLFDTIETRRRALRVTEKPVSGRSASPRHGTIFPEKRRPRAPQAQERILRRRACNAPAYMTQRIAALFTPGELSVMRVIVEEVRKHGSCSITIGEIQGRAAVMRTTVQNAIRRAVEQGLVRVTERRRIGAKNLPNVIEVVSAEWLSVIKHPIGFKSTNPKNNKNLHRATPGAQHHLNHREEGERGRTRLSDYLPVARFSS